MRTDSIYRRLERADRKGGTTYVLDLMIFLQETGGDKFAQALDLVQGQWGFKTSKTALFMGYDAYLPFWRLERASAAAKATEQYSTYDAETTRIIGQRTFEAMSSPDLDPKILRQFAKLEVEREKLKVDQRRVALLEEKAASAKKILEGVKSKGGLSAETRGQIEEAAKLL